MPVSYTHLGVRLMLDAVVDYLPNPLDVPQLNGFDPHTNEVIVRDCLLYTSCLRIKKQLLERSRL